MGWEMFSDGSGPTTARQSAQAAIYPGITDGELSALARSSEAKVRAAVAAHAGTPLTTLLKLAQDANKDVRVAVASNRRPNMPAQVHEDLAKDKDVDVVYELIANPAVSDGLIAKLGRHIHREYARMARNRIAARKAGEAWPPHSDESEQDTSAAALPAVPAFPTLEPVQQRPVTKVELGRERGHSDALDALLAD